MKIKYKLLLLPLGLVLALSSQVAQAKTYAMVIGINQYDYEQVLDGAVNDANDIYNALRQNGIGNIRIFRDKAATKQAIQARWDEMVRLSKPQDTLIVTYSGHGVRRTDHSGDEADGLDEAMALTSYKGDSTKRNSFILDDEWNAWFSKAAGRQIIFVVDACHSGTLDRGMLRGIFKQRSFPAPINHKADPIVDNQPAGSTQRLKNVFMLSATLSHNKINEIEVNGLRRGALSWAFANGMRGKADTIKNDGMISRKELFEYVTKQVARKTEGQVPQFTPKGAFNSNEALFASAGVASPNKKQLSVALSRIGGKHVMFTTTENSFPYLTLYNVTQNGTIQYLYPQSSEEAQKQHSKFFKLKLKIDRDFTGNEQVIVIYSAKPQHQLHKLLTQLNGQTAGVGQLNTKKKRLISGKYEEKSVVHRFGG